MAGDMAAWSAVAEFTKSAQEKGTDASSWALQLQSELAYARVTPPSPELAHVLVSHLCWSNDVPLAWKYMEKALDGGLAPPILFLALLSSRVIPSRHSRPAAYRLYMEFLWRHAFSFASLVRLSNFKRVMVSVDDALHLSEKFGVRASEPGLLVVEFVFYIVWQLLDAILEDEGLLELTPEKKFRWPVSAHDMDIDGEGYCQRNGYGEKLQKINSSKSIELILQFMQHKVTSNLISLVRENMPSHWGSFTRRLQLLSSNSMTLRNLSVLPEMLQHLLLYDFRGSCKSDKHTEFCAFIAPGFMTFAACQFLGASRSSLWIPIDLYLEDCIDGSVAATNAIEILSGKYISKYVSILALSSKGGNFSSSRVIL